MEKRTGRNAATVVTMAAGVAAIALLAGGRSGAGVEGAPMQERSSGVSSLAAHDADGDGRLSRAEFDAAGGWFGMLDRNGDGFLAPDELLPVRPAGMGHGRYDERRGPLPIFRADGDHDGTITRAEWDAFVLALDADGDGTMKPRHARSPEGRRFDEAGNTAPRSRLDADGDGTVTVEDFDRLFAELDRDGSGGLTHDELRAHGRRGR